MGVSMAMGRPKAALVLRLEQREQLEGMASSRSLPAGLVSRARTILLSASGKTNLQIAAETRVSNSTVHGIWQAFGLEPHRQKHFKLSTYPFFVEKVRDIVGL